jgi:hypothetical protein
MGRWSASELYRLYLWCMPLRVAWCHFILSAQTHHSAHVSWRVTWKWSAGNMACSHDKPSWGRTRFRVKKTVEICWDTKLRQETSVLLVEIMIIMCTLNVEELVSSCFIQSVMESNNPLLRGKSGALCRVKHPCDAPAKDSTVMVEVAHTSTTSPTVSLSVLLSTSVHV